MRIRKVNRYYCDFCKKANCSRPSITKHESRCTLNPERKCGMCDLAALLQPEMGELLAALPLPDAIAYPEDSHRAAGMRPLTEEEVKALRVAANNCPACMMAALRQRGIPVPLAEGFNFAAECKTVWDDFNNSRNEGPY